MLKLPGDFIIFGQIEMKDDEMYTIKSSNSLGVHYILFFWPFQNLLYHFL